MLVSQLNSIYAFVKEANQFNLPYKWLGDVTLQDSHAGCRKGGGGHLGHGPGNFSGAWAWLYIGPCNFSLLLSIKVSQMHLQS